jgi:hypothetical protein
MVNKACLQRTYRLLKRKERNSDFARPSTMNLKSSRPSVVKSDLGTPFVANLEVIRNPVKILNYLDYNTMVPTKIVV